MLKCFEIIFAYFERILFDGLVEEDNIQNKYPFSENLNKGEILYECNDYDSSEDDNNVYNYILPFNNYRITRRNIAFC